MSRKVKQQESSGHAPSISKKTYKDSLRRLQVEPNWSSCACRTVKRTRSSSGKSARSAIRRSSTGKHTALLARTHNPMAPWTVVRANDKRRARLNIIKDLLGRLHYTDKDERLIHPDRQIVFAYDVSNLENGQLAK